MLSCVAVQVVLLASVALEQNPWEEVTQDDNLTVWKRDVRGSDFSEYRAQMLVRSSSDAVWKVLLDVDAYPEFMPFIQEVRVLSGRQDPNAVYVYQRLDPPLIDSRDYSLKVSVKSYESLGRYEIRFATANKKGPAPRSDAVRMKQFDGRWEVDQLGPGKTLVTYHLHADPGGMVSGWMADRANNASVPDLMRAVESRAQNPKWHR